MLCIRAEAGRYESEMIISMTQPDVRKMVGVCDTQPIAVEGVRAFLERMTGLEMSWSTASMEESLELARDRTPDLVIVDKAFGMQAILDHIHILGSFERKPFVVVWGVSMTEAEALRLLQAGARGVIRKSADLESLASCVRAVSGGASWMESSVFGGLNRRERKTRSELTAREQQVKELVEQGLKNREVARELGIRPGTVKIHLKHIFEKTGVRGRYGLALNGLQDKPVLANIV
jgi:DNA-binding NarL/FixJ family response regulator